MENFLKCHYYMDAWYLLMSTSKEIMQLLDIYRCDFKWSWGSQWPFEENFTEWIHLNIDSLLSSKLPYESI